MNVRKSVIVAAAALACIGAVSAQNDSLTLQQAIDQVEGHYPSLESAQAAIDAARGRTAQVASARLPQVSLDADYLYTAPRPYVDFSLPTGTSSFYETSQNTYTAGLTGRQLLTDFGQTDALVAQARAREMSATDALEAVRRQLGYQTIQTFYDVILLRESVGVSNEEITALDEALRISKRRFAGGTATKFDVLTTQVRLANAQNAKTDTEAALAKEEAMLRQLLGLEPNAPLRLTGEFSSPSPVPSLSDAISAGLRDRPEMKVARDDEEGAEDRLSAVQRAHLPVLAAQATGGTQNGQLPSLYENRGFVTAGVTLSVPLFTGKRIAGERTEARAGIRSAQGHIAELNRKIVTDVSDALADLNAAAARLTNADLLVSQAQEALALARTRYTNGVITDFELLDAQSANRNAALTRLQARYSWTIARQALAQASGAPAQP